MREKIRQFISELSREEQVEVVHALICGLAPSVKEESAFIDTNGVVVGYYLPIEKWLDDHPRTFQSPYKTEEEATAAAKNGRSLSEIAAAFNAMYPADTDQPVQK